MGLAPYGQEHSLVDQEQSKTRFFIHGNIHDGTLDADRARASMVPDPDLLYSATQSNASARERQESFAYQLQSDVEDVILNFIKWLVPHSGASNIIFAGGVAHNSCVNSKINDLPCVSSFYVSPYPGDEGISIGCAAFGNSLMSLSQIDKQTISSKEAAKKFARMPFLGRHYSAKDIDEAIRCFAPWVDWTNCNGAENVARAIADGAIVGWFDGGSEFGPRALGHRSLLADPRHKSTHVKMNADVKKREPFRPFAPVVLSKFCQDWFYDAENTESTRFMGMTRMVAPEKREIIPAVVHIDGSARLQTVCVDDECDNQDIGEFGKVLTEFYKLTNVPVLLNTSFNVAGEPIVESPLDAMRTFLRTPSISVLGFAHGVMRRRTWTCENMGDEIASACVWLRVSTVSGGFGSSVQAHVEWAPIYAPDIGDGELAHDDNVEDSTQLPYTSWPHFTERAQLVDDLQVCILERVHALQQCSVQLLVEEFCNYSNPADHSNGDGGTESLENYYRFDSDADDDDDNYDDDQGECVTPQDVFNRLLDLHAKLLIFIV